MKQIQLTALSHTKGVCDRLFEYAKISLQIVLWSHDAQD